MRHVLILIAFTVSVQAIAQSKHAKKFAETITESDLKERLSILASDSLEGRETGKEGQRMAAAYIQSKFEEFGLEPGIPGGTEYQQKFPLYKSKIGDVSIGFNGKEYKNYEDIVFFGGGSSEGEMTADAVFIANPQECCEGIDLKGKVAVFYAPDGNWRPFASIGAQNGAIASLMVVGNSDDEFGNMLNRMKQFLSQDRLSLEKPSVDQRRWYFFCGPSLASNLFGNPLDSLISTNDVKTAAIKIKVENELEQVESSNVLGYLPGSDLKDELLVITSHYDHLGKTETEVFNGADDDGSGTTSLLEIAEAFAMAKKKKKGPRRSILFMTVSGEEKGLLGSLYYTDNPVYPLENTVTNLNIDMVGRVDSAHMDNPDYIYVIGADKLSTELHELHETTNKNTLNLTLDYKYNDENDPNRFYYRSDHYNFAKNNIPIIFYFNGVHPDYHQTTDTVEKIDFPVMKKRAQLVYYTAWELANKDKRVKLD